MVSDGIGGMLPVVDRRFDRREWPISFQVPAAEAENWFLHLQSECERRGWSSAGVSQLHSRENSGSLMLLDAGVEKLSVVWDRARGEALNIRARPAADIDLMDAQECFWRVNERSSAGEIERQYHWGVLEYEGRAWRGELWLEDNLRLGPPSKQYEEASRGPRVVIVDAVVDCISQGYLPVVFSQLLEELATFLAVAVNTSFHVPRQRQVWTVTPEGTDCMVSSLGYVETANRSGLPASGTCPPVPMGPAEMTEEELAVPQDIISLWGKYRSLIADRRGQFLGAASKLQEARLLWDARRGTASFASMIIACEALKPADPLYSKHNIYDVVEALLGKETGEKLRTKLFDPKIHSKLHPQSVRSAHLHRGEFHGSEFAHGVMMSNYRDPTFDQATRELFEITKTAITEWLQRGGVFTMRTRNRKKTWRRWLGDHVPAIMVLTMVAGLCLGWLLGKL